MIDLVWTTITIPRQFLNKILLPWIHVRLVPRQKNYLRLIFTNLFIWRRPHSRWHLFWLLHNTRFLKFTYSPVSNDQAGSYNHALFFNVTKTVLVGLKWFWSDQINVDLTIMIWSRPKWNGHNQNELGRSKLWFSTKMNHIWTWPIHFGHDHFILVVTKSLWSSPNQFGKTKTILDRPKLF